MADLFSFRLPESSKSSPRAIMQTISAIIPVFRSAAAALRTIEGLRTCQHPGFVLEIVIVDDGSGDGTVDILRGVTGPDIVLVRHDANQGRVAARNSGMAAARGDVLLFIDADCLPEHPDFLVAHLDRVTPATCSAGAVVSEGGRFWDRYQKTGAARRQRQGGPAIFSSANFMIARDAMERVGGFDPAFRGYGFEDRDLALRLEVAGIRIQENPDASVSHDDDLELTGVCRKMMEAGAGNASLFARRHPGSYRALGYASIDARRHPVLRMLHAFTDPLRLPMIRALSPRLDTLPMPFAITAGIVRLLVAASYLHGTVIARK